MTASQNMLTCVFLVLYVQVLSFFEELRDDNVPPLLDLEHLKVEIIPSWVLPWHDKIYTKLETESTFEEKLVDSLLWCCPYAESITIKKKGRGKKS